MIKEFIIRVDGLKHNKKIERACKKLCKEFEGEYYTKIVDRIDDFIHLYNSLCDKIYKVDGYSYKDNTKTTGKCPDLVRPDLLELKMAIDKRIQGYIGSLEKYLNRKTNEM